MSRVTHLKKRKGFRRHLEGWQPAVLSLFIAGIVAILVVPRSATPRDLPDVAVDRGALAEIASNDAKLAVLAEREPLPHAVRALGSAVRGYGLVDGKEDKVELLDARERVARAAGPALLEGVEEVRRLRAYQVEELIRELRAWLESGNQSEELVALGGNLIATIDRYGWVEHRHGRPRLVIDEWALRVLVKERWNKVTGIEHEALAITAAEERALLHFLLRHPIAPPDIAGMDARAKLAHRNQFLLSKLERIGQIDDSYPVDYARGIIFFRQGRHDLATKSFQGHLDGHPDGPLALRAQNYLRASLERVLQ